MCAEVVFEDTEAEVIVGSQPSTYDAATAVDEMQADPIGGRPSPYQNSVVFNESEIQSGRGQARPGPSHTTRHAGPHRAVRSAFPETAVGVGEPFQASGLVPVGVRQGPLEWPGSGDAPVPLLRRRP